MEKSFSTLLGLFLLIQVSVGNAALESRLGGAAVYDTDLDITWLADANLASTNTFGLEYGVVTWMQSYNGKD